MTKLGVSKAECPSRMPIRVGAHYSCVVTDPVKMTAPNFPSNTVNVKLSVPVIITAADGTYKFGDPTYY